jgi:alpha-1,6-mannosyltransferase
VEESFNMQATHDILEGLGLVDFDHLDFPGVVPRTFIGSLVLAVVVVPFTKMMSLLNVSKFSSQYLVRGALGTLLWACFVYFADSLNKKLKNEGKSSRVGDSLLFLTAFQFHLPFYMSRTLPNTFALSGCLLSYACWLRGRPVKCLCILALFMIIFRCDLLVMIAPLALQMLIAREIPFFKTMLIGIAACLGALTLTTLIDSYFWRRWLWPEGSVLFFNTVENKSSEWGIMPWHWYATSALPRALNVSLALLLIGLVGFNLNLSRTATADDKKEKGQAHSANLIACLTRKVNAYFVVDKETRVLWYYSAPALSFICLYSFLPHKELRFIFPALPLLNILAAKGLNNIHVLAALDGEKEGPADCRVCTSVHSYILQLARLGKKLVIVAGVCIYVVFTLSSMYNYPGGDALRRIHRSHIKKVSQQEQTCSNDGTLNIHIDAAAAMTGVTRFGQIQPRNKKLRIVYSKKEDLEPTKAAYRDFDWLITGDPHASYKSDFSIVEEVFGFHRLELTIRSALANLKGMFVGTVCPIRIDTLAPVAIIKEPKLWIMQNKKMG